MPSYLFSLTILLHLFIFSHSQQDPHWFLDESEIGSLPGAPICFEHITKTGGNLVKAMLKDLEIEHVISGEFEQACDKTKHFVIGIMIEPCEYYPDLWKRGINGGAIRAKYPANDKNIHEGTGKQIYGPKDNVEFFRNWIQVVAESASSFGYWTTRVASKFIPGHERPKDTDAFQQQVASIPDRVHCWLHPHTLNDDTKECLYYYTKFTGGEIDAFNLQKFVGRLAAQTRKARTAAWGEKKCSEYWDDASLATLKDIDGFLMDQMNLECCASEWCPKDSEQNAIYQEEYLQKLKDAGLTTTYHEGFMKHSNLIKHNKLLPPLNQEFIYTDKEFSYMHIFKSGGSTMGLLISNDHTFSKVRLPVKKKFTYVRDPVDHFISGFKECGKRNYEMFQDNPKLYMPPFDEDGPDAQLMAWLDYVEDPTGNGCRMHSKPQYVFLIQDTNCWYPDITVVADMYNMRGVMDMMGIEYDNEVENERTADSDEFKQKNFGDEYKARNLKPETIRGICEYVWLDFCIFGVDIPEACTDIITCPED